MTLEPDEDEDPTRICAKCGVRPRWSRHGTCKRCVECAGTTVRRCILARKNERWEPAPHNARRRQRYAAMKAKSHA